MPRPAALAIAAVLISTFAAPTWGQSSTGCELANWQSCPDAMLVDPIDAGESGVGALQFFSNQIVDLSDYRTAQYLQTKVPAGTSTRGWHAHEFDAIITPIRGKSRFWWLNRDTGEKKSLVFDAARHGYLLIPEGVPHFVDQRAAETEALVVEFLLSREAWTAEDFLSRRKHVDEPVPPILPLE